MLLCVPGPDVQRRHSGICWSAADSRCLSVDLHNTPRQGSGENFKEGSSMICKP